MSAPTFVAMGTGSETAPGIPAGLAAHDYMVLAVESDNEAISTPSGWEAVTAFNNYTGNHTRISLFQIKDCTGSESAPTLSVPINHQWGVIAAFRGANNAKPYHGKAEQIFDALTSQWLPGSRTFVDDCLITQWACYNNDSAGPLFSSETNADLSSLTERYDGGTITGNGGGIYLVTGVKASKGSFGPTQITMGTAGALCAVTLCLQSASGLVLPTLKQKSRICNTRM